MKHLLEKLDDFYQNFTPASLEKLGDIYASDIEFSDPIHAVIGLDNLRQYFAASMNGLHSCHFDFVRTSTAGNTSYIEWVMHYQHQRLHGGAALQLKGVSVVDVGSSANSAECKVIRQCDYYDMGAMLYEHVPVLGHVVKSLKRRVAST